MTYMKMKRAVGAAGCNYVLDELRTGFKTASLHLQVYSRSPKITFLVPFFNGILGA